jgi:hypothetical protein
MTPVASPRHPWKALAVVLVMFAVVHSAGAHVFSHGHGGPHVHITHGATFDRDCGDVDIDVDDDGPDDDDVVINVADMLDDDDWN